MTARAPTFLHTLVLWAIRRGRLLARETHALSSWKPSAAFLVGVFLKDLIKMIPGWLPRIVWSRTGRGAPLQVHGVSFAGHWAPTLLQKAGSAGLAPHCFARLRAGLDSYADERSPVGPNLCAVIVDGSVPFLHRSGCDWNEDSLFRIFSMTKPIVAVAFLTLVERGLVSLDDAVSDYIPCFQHVRVLGVRARQRNELFEKLSQLVFEPQRNSKAHDSARVNGSLRDDGFMKLAFILRSFNLQKLNLQEDVAFDMLKNVAAVEMQVDGYGTAWLRRRGQEKLPSAVDADPDPQCETPRSPITLRMLMTHTAGFGYDFSLYRTPPTIVHKGYGQLARDVEQGVVQDLAGWVERLAQIPLLFQPGEEFKYGYSFDVLGRVAEVVSGMTLDEFLQSTVLGPMNMCDTGFSVPPSKLSRLVPLRRHPHDHNLIDLGSGSFLDKGDNSSCWAEGSQSRVLSAGGAVETYAGGLVSSMRDYTQFLQMILHGGVAPNGRRIISAETVDMAIDPRQLAAATKGFVIESFPGRSFGLLGEVVGPRSAAEGLVSWGGTAGTYYGVHPRQGYAFVFFAQSFGAPKVKGLFENELCPRLA